MTLFVTGAAGFVGRNVVQKLRALRHHVIAVDAIKLAGDDDIIQADIRSRNINELIPEGADAIIHLAGLTRDADCRGHAVECFEINVMATLNLIEAARTKKVKQFVFASSEWVYDSFADGEKKTEETEINVNKIDSEYALSKLVSEQNLRQQYKHGFCDVTILRFGIIYGPRKGNWSAVESLFNAVRTGGLVSVGSVRTGRCFVHVSDIADGIISSIGLKGFHTINLQGDHLITLREIIEVSQEIHNKNVRVEEKSPNIVSQRWVSNQRAKELLKWTPRITLNEGLRTLL